MDGPTEVLFVHEDSGFAPPNRILLIPMGVFALADLLVRRGIRARILHLGIERSLDPRFDLAARIRSLGVRMVCFDLHWHQQTRRVLEQIRAVKRTLPRVSVVLGGFTASYFHEELLDRVAEADFVVRGDAEEPLLALARLLLGGKGAPKDIPNLSFRRAGKTVSTPLSYSLTQKVFDGLRYSRFELLDHHPHYNQQEVGWGQLKGTLGSQGWFYFNPGRGCPHVCSPCGGSASAHRLLRGHVRVLFKSIPSVLRDLARAARAGLGTWVVNFDPSQDKSYYLELFAGIRRERLPLRLRFAVMTLPDEDFLDAMGRTFSRVTLDFVLQTGSEELRRRNKSVFIGNAVLLALAGSIQRRGNIDLEFCLGVGWPFETRRHVVETLGFIDAVRERCPRTVFVPLVLDMEPAAPWQVSPSKYGVVSRRARLEDFSREHEDPADLGVARAGWAARDLWLAAEYYRVESRCEKPRSLMLESLLRRPAQVPRLDFARLHTACLPCARHDDCFKALPRGGTGKARA